MTTTRKPRQGDYLVAGPSQPLIAVPVDRDGCEYTYYFVDHETADKVLGEQTLQEALAVIGAWSDLDWDEVQRELDRIRHESKPTPPLDDLDI